MSQGIVNPVFRLFFKGILIAWAICVLYPLIWTILSALKDNQQFFLGRPWDLPKLPLLWSNFSYVWGKYNFGHNFMNSLVVTVVSTIFECSYRPQRPT